RVCLLGYGFGMSRIGGWFATVVSAWSVPVKTLNSAADLICRIGATCQLLARIRSVRLENFGVVATKLRTNCCRRSIPAQLPRYSRRLFRGTFPVEEAFPLYTSPMQWDQV